jgi:aerobic C4-dicarboxylate transport protein
MSLWVQVLFATVLAVAFGYLYPQKAAAMKRLGDGFIGLITMVIILMIFCTAITGIAGMQDIKKIGRIGVKALLYFEVVSTLALFIGLVVGILVHPGAGFEVNVATLDTKAVDASAMGKRAKPLVELVEIVAVPGRLQGTRPLP